MIQQGDWLSIGTHGIGEGKARETALSILTGGLFKKKRPVGSNRLNIRPPRTMEEVRQMAQHLTTIPSNANPTPIGILPDSGWGDNHLSRVGHTHKLNRHTIVRLVATRDLPENIAAVAAIGVNPTYAHADHVHKLEVSLIQALLHDNNLDLGTGDLTCDVLTATGAVTLGTLTGILYGTTGIIGTATVATPLTFTAGTLDLSFSTTNLKDDAGSLNTIQDIAPSSNPTFAMLTATSGIRIREGGASPSKYTTFYCGTQSTNLDYQLPTSHPGSVAFWKCEADGVISFDTSTYLTAESDTLQSVCGRGAIYTGSIGTAGYIATTGVVGNAVFTASVTGDSWARFSITAAGGMAWGTGADAADATLARTAAGQLTSNSEIVATAFTIGANSLTAAEFANLDGINQTVATTSSPTFVTLNATTASLGLGAVGTPSLTTATDTNTGIYWNGSDGLILTAGGNYCAGVQYTGAIARFYAPRVYIGSFGTATEYLFYNATFVSLQPSGHFSMASNKTMYFGGSDSYIRYIRTGVTDNCLCLAGDGVVIPNGTVSLPGLNFSSDTDCGLYRIGSNNIGFAVNGSKILDIGTGGLTVTGTTTTSSGFLYPGAAVPLGGTRFAMLLTAGDANPIFKITEEAAGEASLYWGAGGASAVDVRLYRSAADVLSTPDTFAANYLDTATFLNLVIYDDGTADTPTLRGVTGDIWLSTYDSDGTPSKALCANIAGTLYYVTLTAEEGG